MENIMVILIDFREEEENMKKTYLKMVIGH
jgi:hypothetical protein